MRTDEVIAPRLLDVNAAAKYLGGISTWTVRALVVNGKLVPVRLPACRRPGKNGRRLLFAREDLDTVIDRWKRESSAAPNAGLSAAALEGWKRTPIRGRKSKAATP